MNSTSATLDRDDTAIRHPGPLGPGHPCHGRHARPSRARRWLIGSGAVVVAGAAVVAGLMASTSHRPPTRPPTRPGPCRRQPGRADPRPTPRPPTRPSRPPPVKAPAPRPRREPRCEPCREPCRGDDGLPLGCPGGASEGTGTFRSPRCPPTSRQASDPDAAPSDAAASERPDGDLRGCAEQRVDLGVQPAERDGRAGHVQRRAVVADVVAPDVDPALGQLARAPARRAGTAR